MSLEVFYSNQIQQIRKKLRLLDMKLCPESYDNQKSLNLLIIGQNKSGKKSLINTLNRALNGKQSKLMKQTNCINRVSYQKYHLKRGRKSEVKGLFSLKQTEQKFGVYSYLLKMDEPSYNPTKLQKVYQIALQFIKSQSYCNSQASINSCGINLIWICLSTSKLISDKQAIQLRNLLQKIQQSKLQYLIIGTKIDQIVSENQDDQIKSIAIEAWRDAIYQKLKLKRKSDIFCLENYHLGNNIGFLQQKIIDFYALSLLEQCLQKINQQKQLKKPLFNFSCLCIN